MARYGSDYGPGGISHDEFGPLPAKRIENMQGIDGFSSKAPFSASSLKYMIIDYHNRTGKIPKKYHHQGPSKGSPGIGIITPEIGYLWIDFVPESPEDRLE